MFACIGLTFQCASYVFFLNPICHVCISIERTESLSFADEDKINNRNNGRIMFCNFDANSILAIN